MHSVKYGSPPFTAMSSHRNVERRADGAPMDGSTGLCAAGGRSRRRRLLAGRLLLLLLRLVRFGLLGLRFAFELAHELDERHLGGVAAAGAELDDPGVTAGAPLEALGEIEKHLLDEIDFFRLAVDDARSKAREERADQALRV